MKLVQLCSIAVPFFVTMLVCAVICEAETIIDRPGTILVPEPKDIIGNNSSATDPFVVDGVSVYGRRAYDRFTVPSARFPLGADISRVSWEMIVWNMITQLPPGALEATSYEVSFYSTASGQPNVSVSSTTYAPSALTLSFLGIEVASPGVSGHNGQVYRVTADLPSAFRAAPDTEYWLSLQVRTPTARPAYGWTGDLDIAVGHSFQDYFDQNGQFMRRLDRGSTLNYTLEGTAVPEPRSLGLMIAASGTMLICVLRSRALRRTANHPRKFVAIRQSRA